MRNILVLRQLDISNNYERELASYNGEEIIEVYDLDANNDGEKLLEVVLHDGSEWTVYQDEVVQVDCNCEVKCILKQKSIINNNVLTDMTKVINDLNAIYNTDCEVNKATDSRISSVLYENFENYYTDNSKEIKAKEEEIYQLRENQRKLEEVINEFGQEEECILNWERDCVEHINNKVKLLIKDIKDLEINENQHKNITEVYKITKSLYCDLLEQGEMVTKSAYGYLWARTTKLPLHEEKAIIEIAKRLTRIN